MFKYRVIVHTADGIFELPKNGFLDYKTAIEIKLELKDLYNNINVIAYGNKRETF